MTLASFIRVALLLSIWLLVLSLGARTAPGSAVYVLRRPVALARVLAAIFVVVPMFAVLLAATTSVPPAIKFAIVAMSVGPVPPILPYKQMKAGGEADYALGVLVAAALASIVLTPLLVAVAARLLGAQAGVGAAHVARTVLLTIGLPLAAGMVLRAVWERGAGVFSRYAQGAGSAVLLAVLVLMVIAARRDIFGLLGDGAALAIAATVAVGLLAGHLLARPSHRAALALAAATRHPGVALTIADLSYPDQRKPIMAAILIFLIVNIFVTTLYVRWVRGKPSALDAAPAQGS